MAETLSTIMSKPRADTLSGIRTVMIPHMLFPPVVSTKFNRKSLDMFVRSNDVETIINANGVHFGIGSSTLSRVNYVYDLVDDHLSPSANRTWKRVRDFTLREIRNSQAVITISRSLQRILEDFGVAATVVPNGVDIARCAMYDQEALQSLRCEYGLSDRPVVAYIGNHNTWFSNSGFLLRAFRLLRKERKDAALLIVGPVLPAEANHLRHEPGVVVTGSVPVERVHLYFQIAHVGVVPFLQMPFTNHSLPLKVLEFGGARKPVIATPLSELRLLRLPHVTLLPLDEHLWAEALKAALDRDRAWDPAWDERIKQYDWPNALKPLDTLIGM